MSFIHFFVDRPQHKANSLVRNETVYLGRDATFYCRTEAVPTNIQYSWFKGDNQISNSQEYTINNFGNAESRLIVKQVKKSSAGRYSCYGRNDVGNGHKKSVFLTVHCKLYAHRILNVSKSILLAFFPRCAGSFEKGVKGRMSCLKYHILKQWPVPCYICASLSCNRKRKLLNVVKVKKYQLRRKSD